MKRLDAAEIVFTVFELNRTPKGDYLSISRKKIALRDSIGEKMDETRKSKPKKKAGEQEPLRVFKKENLANETTYKETYDHQQGEIKFFLEKKP